jgi:DNA-binding MarR family transcriptional regulator
MGERARRPRLSDIEREALAARVQATRGRAAVERVLISLGIDSLPADEQRVLRVITEGLAHGEPKKAVEMARETGLSMPELEAVCDRLLDKGLIGPARSKR